MSPATSTATGGNARERRRRFKLVAVLLALTVALVIPEIVVRCVAPELRSFRAMQFGGDANSFRLFVKDPTLHWALRARVEVPFLGVKVRTDARGFRIDAAPEVADGAACILCLGDSTTFGWGVAAKDCFPQVLEQSLRRRQPERSWVVHNAGVPGYSSHQMRLVAERRIPELEPQFVVICVGNNDAWPVRRSDRAVHDASGLSRAVVGLLDCSDFLTWAAEALRGDEPPENPIHLAGDSVPRVDEDAMADNLEAVIALARRHGARPLVLGAPANLESPPRNMDATIHRWQSLGDRVYALIQAGNTTAARDLIDGAQADEHDRLFLGWLRAMVTVAVDRDRGRDELEQVFERHPYPDRARRSYRERQQQVAAENEVPFADVNVLFRTDRGADASKLYLDWCHPTPAGHRLIASQLLRWICD